MRNGPERLQMPFLVRELRELFAEVPDSREPRRIDFPLVDVLLGGLAMMFFQDPGVLPFQKRMEDQTGSSNLATLFGVSRVPSDTHLRDLVDPIDPAWLLKGLRRLLTAVEKTRIWQEFHWLDGRVLVALDGTEFYHSDKLRCPFCLEKHHKDGRVEYYHQVLVAVLLHPKTGAVLPLWAEEIRRGDGATKQDCEFNAARRLLPILAKTYCHLDIVLVADSLYSKSPMIELVRSSGMNYLFVAKPGDHPHLHTELTGLRLAGGVESVQEQDKQKGKVQFEFTHDVPVFAQTDLISHWVGYSEERAGKKPGYKNGWVTNIKPGKRNVRDLVHGGRLRSKIENQTFNALKNHGYHFEHNFGHGSKNLRFNFLLLNLTAFLMHQLLGLGDKLYQEALSWKGTAKDFVEHIRVAIRLATWPDWMTLLNFFLERGVKLRIESG